MFGGKESRFQGKKNCGHAPVDKRVGLEILTFLYFFSWCFPISEFFSQRLEHCHKYHICKDFVCSDGGGSN